MCGMIGNVLILLAFLAQSSTASQRATGWRGALPLPVHRQGGGWRLPLLRAPAEHHRLQYMARAGAGESSALEEFEKVLVASMESAKVKADIARARADAVVLAAGRAQANNEVQAYLADSSEVAAVASGAARAQSVVEAGRTASAAAKLIEESSARIEEAELAAELAKSQVDEKNREVAAAEAAQAKAKAEEDEDFFAAQPALEAARSARAVAKIEASAAELKALEQAKYAASVAANEEVKIDALLKEIDAAQNTAQVAKKADPTLISQTSASSGGAFVLIGFLLGACITLAALRFRSLSHPLLSI
eukprot:gnl/TRDRNA2_/TRDRNA2_127452_c1_seq1.p1 gnl/TRDRNA2_/TRDRNA2_127452_c1~~gnl/TRDRNA2_/TRDRNA2_127452_c1_seq1.p1  ORF type:complete len:306 (+),score=71.31 gnl/TRDRNA2_/TRDRNA2_127452_c1_seq1:70-987(+)